MSATGLTTSLTYWADTGGNDAWTAECDRCYRKSGWLYRKDAEAWRCPDCSPLPVARKEGTVSIRTMLDRFIDDLTYSLDSRTARLSRMMGEPVPRAVRDRMTRYRQKWKR